MENNIAFYRRRYRQIERESKKEKKKYEFWGLWKSTAKVSFLSLAVITYYTLFWQSSTFPIPNDRSVQQQ